MAKFKVGERVRFVRSRKTATSTFPEGVEVVIDWVFSAREKEMRMSHGHLPSDYAVHVAGNPGWLGAVAEWQLEPLTNPGQETVDWSKSLCRPDGGYNPSGDHLPVMTPEFARAWGGA